MKLAGIVGLGEIFTTEDGRRIALYKLNILEEYSPDVIRMIDSLATSKLSIKDKRILDRSEVADAPKLTFSYQFRVTPDEHPELFEHAA